MDIGLLVLKYEIGALWRYRATFLLYSPFLPLFVMLNAKETFTANSMLILKNKRTIFLDSFLRLFDAEEINYIRIDNSKVFGTIIYSDGDEQDFCWHMTEDKAPSEDVVRLIKIVKDYELVDIDKLVISPVELFIMTAWTDKDKFEKALNVLWETEVKMVDNNEETDAFFLHN